MSYLLVPIPWTLRLPTLSRVPSWQYQELAHPLWLRSLTAADALAFPDLILERRCTLE